MFFCLLAILGGVLLWVSQPPRHWPWLQVPALTALVYAVQPTASSPYSALIGFVFALAYVLPQLVELRLPVAISALLFVSQTFVWTLFSLAAAYLFRLSPLPFVFSVACLGAVLMWLEWSILPLWGTAQNFARGWTHVPQWVQFVAYTGVAGLDWVLFLVAASIAQVALRPQHWLGLVSLLAVVTIILGFLNFIGWNRLKGDPTLRVAVFGWAGTDFAASVSINGKLVREAAEQGAKLLVTPEAAVQVENRESFRHSLKALAAQYRIALAIGYFDTKRQENCIDFIDAQGEIRDRYVKTHLVPLFENYQRGTGQKAQMEVGGVNLGGLICQDDNFADIAGKYGRSSTQFLAIPTHDWAAVKEFHYANSRWRALEYRLGIVRAASQGISAIVAPNGQVLARCDHFKEGVKLLVADVPLDSGKPTFYAIARDWLPLFCLVFLMWKMLTF